MKSKDEPPATSWTYTERDAILYALSVGCTAEETRYVYESDSSFTTLPTFGVLPLHRGALEAVDVSKLLPNFNPMMLLHGEQYLEVHKPLPTAATVETRTEVIDVIDKVKAAVVILGLTTSDRATGEVLVRNEVTTFVRGSGGFGKKSPKPREPEAVAQNEVPDRAADTVTRERTDENQAALYRLNGDSNPLHIDGEFAGVGGFPKPILHGLCTFGVAAKHVLKAYGDGDPTRVKSIKGRFAKHVFPGETLQTEMWRISPERIVFRVRVLERDVLAISNAAVVFRAPERSKL